MRIKLLSLALGLTAMFAPSLSAADTFVNLTPTPAAMSVGTGSLTLPKEFSVASTALADSMRAEVRKFAAAMHNSGFTVTEAASGLITVKLNAAVPAEAYKLSVTTSGATIEAGTTAGLYYAFQTIRKVLPAHVMAEMPAMGATTYALPVMEISDRPRYVHRGYELDCARHFFSVEQVKRMLDVMSYYKMNRLHWHLTDDQGWRIEIPKYPKLIEAAATAPNAYWWDFDNHYEYYLNRPYGPHYFTVEELKEVVAYAKERHIEVIPEVDMPGHMEAAIAAYPQMSTNPSGEYQVRYWPGVSTNILDVSNPAVMQFCRDVMDELIEIFPYEYIHIGGDECPKTAWANSPSVQAMKQELGITTDAALQCWFSKQIADYVKPKGKRLICWNEVLTAEGADTKMVQDADILIYDWLGGTRTDGPSYQAAKLGLRSVWCSTYHYYIDYSQWSGGSEPKSMSGPITLETIYNVQPSTAPASEQELLPLYYGVQCNLWTEYVAEPKHVEYNSLPRMIAVAETGWSPQNRKNFADFKKRFNADTELLDLRGYTYGKHYVESKEPTPELTYPAADTYYRLITRASHDAGRRDRCVELVRQGSPLISSKSASVGKVWTNTQAGADDAAYDWQYWTFEADPAGSGKFAMVCRAMPSGSVSPDMEGSSVNARWNYDNSAKHYNFVLGEHFGKEESSYYYSIRSDKNSSWWLNCGQEAQNNSVNNWSDPADGNGGLWLFALENNDEEVYPEFTYLEQGKSYIIANASDDFAGVALADGNADTYLRHSSGEWNNDVWTVEESTVDAEHHIQTVTLRNAATGRYISGGDSDAVSSTPGVGFFSGDAGYPVRVGSDKPSAPNVRIVAWEGHDDLKFSVNDRNLYPLAAGSKVNPSTISSGSTTAGNAIRNQGAMWTAKAVTPYTVKCVDTDGNALATFVKGATSADFTTFPIVENHTYRSHTVSGTTVTAVYERSAWNLTYVCRLADGTLVRRVTEPAAVGSTVTLKAPEVPYFTFVSFPANTTSVTPEADVEVEAVYTTDAHIGVAGIDRAVSKLEDGKTYILYDADPRGGGRNVYRFANAAGAVMGTSSVKNADASYLWVAEASGSNFKFKNKGHNLYIPKVFTTSGGNLIKLSEQGEPFVCTYNPAAGNWRFRNQSDNMYWDGNTDGSLSGWSQDQGQPVEVFTFEAAPLYEVKVTEVGPDGKTLATRATEVPAGSEYLFAATWREGLYIASVTGNEGVDCVESHKEIVVTYTDQPSAIDDITADDAPARNATGIYDLQGRRLPAVTRPGIYIINSQKTIIK